MMLYESGILFEDVGVSRSTLSFDQKFEYQKVSNQLNELNLFQLKEVIKSTVRTLAIQIYIARNLTLSSLLDLKEEFPLKLPLEKEFELRQSQDELEEITDLERLKQYYLTLLLGLFRVRELLRNLRE